MAVPMTIYQAVEDLRQRISSGAHVLTAGVGTDESGRKWITIWSGGPIRLSELTRGKWAGWPVEILRTPPDRPRSRAPVPAAFRIEGSTPVG